MMVQVTVLEMNFNCLKILCIEKHCPELIGCGGGLLGGCRRPLSGDALRVQGMTALLFKDQSLVLRILSDSLSFINHFFLICYFIVLLLLLCI